MPRSDKETKCKNSQPFFFDTEKRKEIGMEGRGVAARYIASPAGQGSRNRDRDEHAARVAGYYWQE